MTVSPLFRLSQRASMAKQGFEPVSSRSSSNHYNSLAIPNYIYIGSLDSCCWPKCQFCEWMIKDMSWACFYQPWLISVNDNLWILTAKKSWMNLCGRLTVFPTPYISALTWQREQGSPIYHKSKMCLTPSWQTRCWIQRAMERYYLYILPCFDLTTSQKPPGWMLLESEWRKRRTFCLIHQAVFALLEQMTPQA